MPPALKRRRRRAADDGSGSASDHTGGSSDDEDGFVAAGSAAAGGANAAAIPGGDPTGGAFGVAKSTFYATVAFNAALAHVASYLGRHLSVADTEVFALIAGLAASEPRSCEMLVRLASRKAEWHSVMQLERRYSGGIFAMPPQSDGGGMGDGGDAAPGAVTVQPCAAVLARLEAAGMIVVGPARRWAALPTPAAGVDDDAPQSSAFGAASDAAAMEAAATRTAALLRMLNVPQLKELVLHVRQQCALPDAVLPTKEHMVAFLTGSTRVARRPGAINAVPSSVVVTATARGDRSGGGGIAVGGAAVSLSARHGRIMATLDAYDALVGDVARVEERVRSALSRLFFWFQVVCPELRSADPGVAGAGGAEAAGAGEATPGSPSANAATAASALAAVSAAAAAPRGALIPLTLLLPLVGVGGASPVQRWLSGGGVGPAPALQLSQQHSGGVGSAHELSQRNSSELTDLPREQGRTSGQLLAEEATQDGATVPVQRRASSAGVVGCRPLPALDLFESRAAFELYLDGLRCEDDVLLAALRLSFASPPMANGTANDGGDNDDSPNAGKAKKEGQQQHQQQQQTRGTNSVADSALEVDRLCRRLEAGLASCKSLAQARPTKPGPGSVDDDWEDGYEPSSCSSSRKAPTVASLLRLDAARYGHLACFLPGHAWAAAAEALLPVLERARRFDDAAALLRVLLESPLPVPRVGDRGAGSHTAGAAGSSEPQLWFKPRKRGHWAARLVIDLGHAKRAGAAVDAGERAIVAANDAQAAAATAARPPPLRATHPRAVPLTAFLRRSDRLALERATLRLFVPPRRWCAPPSPLLSSDLRVPTHITIHGRRDTSNGQPQAALAVSSEDALVDGVIAGVEHGGGGFAKTRWAGTHRNAGTVEARALRWYVAGRGRRERGWCGVHCEGSWASSFFTVFFFDALYGNPLATTFLSSSPSVPPAFLHDPGDYVFLSPFQTMPLDLSIPGAFYARRGPAIDAALAALRAMPRAEFVARVEAFARAGWDEEAQAPRFRCFGVAWRLPLVDIARAVPIVPLADLFAALLASPPASGHIVRFSGFPDLVLWRTAESVAAAEAEAEALAASLSGAVASSQAKRKLEAADEGDDAADPGQCENAPSDAVRPTQARALCLLHAAPAPGIALRAASSTSVVRRSSSGGIPAGLPQFVVSEVKSPSDSLSDKQICVNDLLLRCGFVVDVLHVADADASPAASHPPGPRPSVRHPLAKRPRGNAETRRRINSATNPLVLD